MVFGPVWANLAVRFEQWMHHVLFKTSSFPICVSLSHVPELITKFGCTAWGGSDVGVSIFGG